MHRISTGPDGDSRGARWPASAGDLERCLRVGREVLRLLDEGVDRVEVYRYMANGKERVRGLRVVDDT